MKITKSAHEVLSGKLKEIQLELKAEEKKKGQDIHYFEIKEKEVAEMEKFMSETEIFEFSEKNPATVIIGAKITLEDMNNGDTRDFTIMTRNTASPIKGIISYESPMAQKMLNLKLGNTFKFKEFSGGDVTYKIKKIEQ